VLVAEIDGLPQGFITCHIRENRREGDIGLVGVSEQARGQGVGKSLMKSALCYYYELGVNSVFIAMQGSNIVAQRLCEQTGFSMYSLRLWYHKWFSGCFQDKTSEGDIDWNR
jgi:GNAT superfamily N-acetyltransferase